METILEPLIAALKARKLLAGLKREGGSEIGKKTLSHLVTHEGLPAHPDPFGTGRRVYLESEIRTWWTQKLKITVRPIASPGRPRKERP